MDREKVIREIKNKYIDFFRKNPNPLNIQKRELYEELLAKSTNNKLIDFELFFQGSLSLLNNDPTKAKQYFNLAIKEDKNNPFPYNSLGLIELEDLQVVSAIKYFTSSTDKDDTIYFVWYNLGRAYEKLLSLDKAKKCYEHVLKLEDGNQDAKNGLESVKDKRDQFKEFKLSKFKPIDGFYIFADIRGFTDWSKDIGQELEIEKLFNSFYPTAMSFFGNKKSDSINFRRIVKYLGDGFFAIEEFSNEDDVPKIIKELITSIHLFTQSVYINLKNKRLPKRENLQFAFGIAYSRAQRFKYRGNYDWTGNKVNLASRLCSEASNNEILIEDSLKSELEEINIQFEPKEIKVKGYNEIKALSVNLISL